MQVVYTPDGAEKREWVFKPGEMRSIEAEAIEDATGWTVEEWGQKALFGGSAKARRCLLWILLRRDDPRVELRDVDYAMSELFVDWDDEEAERLRLVLESATDLDATHRATLTEALGNRRPDPGKGQPPRVRAAKKATPRADARTSGT